MNLFFSQHIQLIALVKSLKPFCTATKILDRNREPTNVYVILRTETLE